MGVLKKNVLRRIFEPKREEGEGGWRRLQNKELHNLYGSPNIIGVMKSNRVRCAWHVARMGKTRLIQNFNRKTLKKETTRKT
jgi:hypothetical protein